MKKKKKKVVIDDSEAAPVSAPAASAEPVESPTTAKELSKPAAEPQAEAVEAPSAGASGTATPVEADKAAEDGGDLFADMKKKKKKKKDIPLDLDIEPAAPDGLDVGMKKKKSKKAASDFAKELDEMDAEAEAEELDGEGDGDDPFANGDDDEVSGKEAWVVEGRDPTYPELLKRFFTLLHQHNPELAGEKRKYTVVPPQVARDGTKKTMFSNLVDICRRMHREPTHVIQFLYSELGTTGSVDGSQRLIMKGRYTQKQIETMLKKYIVEYVTCKICKSGDTILERDNRLNFVTCQACGSKRSVSAIKAGYQMQGKRVKPV